MREWIIIFVVGIECGLVLMGLFGVSFCYNCKYRRIR